MNHAPMPAPLGAIAHRVMLERGLQPEFSQDAKAELAAITRPASPSGPDVRDLRELLWCSIDNDDSRDLDQLSVAVSADDGVRILVAIADVDALVAIGSAIDAHAATNTTSVYTAAGIFPMLPEKLSTNLTSLGERDDRLALVVDMTTTPQGEVASSDLYRAVVRNHAKLAYNAVAAWLDGAGPAPERLAAVRGLDAQLRIQDDVAQRLKRSRHERGALTLDTLEVRPVFAADGALEDLRPDTKNRAKELIENFMIAANVVTATFLDHANFPSLRRVLDTPTRWPRIVELAAASGYKLPASADAAALDAFLLQSRKRRPRAFRRRVARRRQAARFRRVRRRKTGACGRGSFRPCREGLRTFDCTEPAVSRSRHATARQGGAHRPLAAVFAVGTGSARAALHEAGGQRDQSRAAGAEIGGRTTAGAADRQAVRWHRDRRVRERNVGPYLVTDGRGARRARIRGSRRR